jgi:uncharacterized protein (TIGR02996 family)
VSDEERGLLEAILETPDDDAPRLVYADWLQGRGDPRGELIQLQCQLAAAPDDDRRRNIKIAENKLLEAHAAAWKKPMHAALPREERPDLYGFGFVRGFIEYAKISMSCIPHLDSLFAAAPLIRTLCIVPGGPIGDLNSRVAAPKLDGALASPYFARLHTLELALPGGGNELAYEVARASTLGNLRGLRLWCSIWGELAMYYDSSTPLVIDDDGAVELARSPHLGALELLDLESNRLTAVGLQSLSTGPWKLRELNVGSNLIDLDSMPPKKRTGPHPILPALAAPAFANLEILSLSANSLAPRDIAAIVGGPHFAKLRELDLERCHLGVQGIAALCKAFALPSLRRLRLERNSLCDAGATAIADCDKLANLTSLEAGHNLIGRKGGTAIATSPHFTKLERLTLNEPRWKPEMKTTFAESPTLANAKIYLAGRLVGRAKPSKSKATAETAAVTPKPKKPAKSSAKPAETSKPRTTAKSRAKRTA